MKNLIYIITLCLPMLIIGQNEIQTEADFNGRHCRGTVGLCNISSGIEGKNANNSNLSYDMQKGLLLTVKADKLTEEEVIKMLGESLGKSSKNKDLKMTIEEDFELDTTLVKELKIPYERFVIKAGSYPVTYNNNLLQVVFKVD